jgi:hypothetical protein
MTPAADAGPPLHGYRGTPTPPPLVSRPLGVTVAVSREAGSRGGSIAASVGRRLGWQVYTQEMLDFLVQDDAARAEVLAEVPEAARLWAELEFGRLAAEWKVPKGSGTEAIARLVLALAARGNTVLVGRGAGFVLPRPTTVHVRIVAPVAQRVAYMSQWLRLTEDEAAAEVRSRDRRRAEFLAALTERDVTDPAGYDAVLNSALLGIETAAELIATVARIRQPVE